ncbi:MAG: DUF3999 domain-containing protein [Rhodanobacteraceae bacterium]
MRRFIGFVLILLPVLCWAGYREDYARQWPLRMQDPQADAYRVVLSLEVYRSSMSASLGDIDVFNADGRPVPAALFEAQTPLAQPPHRIALPWFALPRGSAAQARDITLISERDADGHLRRVETRLANAQPQGGEPANAWLIDASGVHRRIVALLLDWPTATSPLDVAYRVEGSDELRTWRTLQPRVQLLDLMRNDQRLRQRRIALDGDAHYLRLLPLSADAALPLAGVTAELAPIPAAQNWQWMNIEGKPVEEKGRRYVDFTLDGHFPVARADIDVGSNDAGEWTLQSRDDVEHPWHTRAGPWVAFRVGKDTVGDRSAAQALNGIFRDRYWRLSSRSPTAGLPTLRLAYRPEVMVFLANGKPPFALAAGSARATRADAPLPQLVAALRKQHGSEWQPATATLGGAEMLAGPQALVPRAQVRDWKDTILWTLLVAGALVVAALAIGLLRKAPGGR